MKTLDKVADFQITEMADERRLLCILAHPDDESMGTGGILARYAAEGVKTYLITATRGERGWADSKMAYPGPVAVARVRERELRNAARVLNLEEAVFLDYPDGGLDKAQPQRLIAELAAHIRRIRPHVVVTFDPFGAYGHPDHIAISQFATAAIVLAAHGNGQHPPHSVSKLYYLVATAEHVAAYQDALGELVLQIDGTARSAIGWQPWAITTVVDTSDYWQQVWEAISCHRSQLDNYQHLQQLSEQDHRFLWGLQQFYRAFSLVNGGRQIERDLFEGLA